MKQVVVDTDVVSFLFKGSAFSRLYEDAVLNASLLISFMTVAELEQWVLRNGWSSQKRDWLRLSLHRYTIVPSSNDICAKWAEVMTMSRSRGRRMETADAFIAATALLYDIPLVTHNRRDYSSIPNLKLISHA